MKIPNNWTFNSKSIAKGFDSHVREQLPWYNMASDLVCHLARSYLSDNATILDLACSTGNITKRLESTIKDRNINTVSIDSSEEMKDYFNGVGEITIGDMLDIEIIPNYDVCVIMLGVMFLPIEKRKQFLYSLMHKAKEGAATIIVDKVTPHDGYIGQVVTKMAIRNKLDAGVSSKLILEKELSLSGVQRPSASSMYNSFGFKKWLQVGDFCGYICEKDG